MPIQFWIFYDKDNIHLGETHDFSEWRSKFPEAVKYSYYENGKFKHSKSLL